MSFYAVDLEMTSFLKNLLKRFSQGRREDFLNHISVLWIHYKENNPKPGSGVGAQWHAEKLMYPASIVKIFFAVAAEEWIRKDWILDSPEVQRALKNMLAYSSNDATSLIVDLLTGTASGP